VIYALRISADIIVVPPNVLNSDGGTFRESNVTLYMSPSAIPDQTEFKQSPATGYPAYSGLVGTPVLISPEPLVFNDSARLSLSYDPAALPSGTQETGLFLAKLVNGVWTALSPSSVDTTAHTVTAVVSGTGTYSVCIPGLAGLNVPPAIGTFTVSTSILAQNTSTSVTFNWTYANTPTPAPTAKLYPEGQPELAAAITNGSAANINIAQDTTYILKTENAAGTSEKAVTFLTAAAPQIANFRISPAIVPLNTATPVTWSWDYAQNPMADCNCTVSGGTVTNGTVSQITLSNTQQVYTLTCTNIAGSNSKTFTVYGLPSSPFSMSAGPAGASLSLPNGIKLEIPEGALSKDVIITMSPLTQFPADKTLIGMPFKLEPNGLAFNIPATLTIPYVQSVLDAIGIQPDKIAITTVMDNEWAAKHTTVDTTAGSLSTLISHFSDYSTQDDYPSKPLSEKLSKIIQGGEIAEFLPKRTDTTFIGGIRDDATGTYTPYKKFDTNFGYDKEPARIAEVLSGDITGDGKDDMVVASLYKSGTYSYEGTTYRQQYIRLTFINGNGAVFHTMDLKTEGVLAAHDSYYQVDIALGDVDGDGIKELIVAGSYGRIKDSDGSTAMKYSHVFWIFDDVNTSNFALLKKFTKDSSNPAKFDVAVTSGDVDGDGLDEIVWMYRQDNGTRVAATITDDKSHSFATLDTLYYTRVTAGEIFTRNEGAEWLNVAIGDFDGDGRSEMIFGETMETGLKAEIFRYDTNEKKAKIGKTKWIGMRGEGGVGRGKTRPVFAIGDFNGDGKDEAAFSTPLYAGFDCGDGWNKTFYHVWWVSEDKVEQLPVGDSAQLGMIAAGDTNRDGKDDLVVVFATDGNYYTQLYQVNSSGVFEKQKEWAKQHDYKCIWNQVPYVSIGDYDGDNILLEYTGESKDVTTDAIPIIAVAAPPVWGTESIDQNRGDSQSAYGTEANKSTTTGNEVGVSVGVTLSFEAADPFGFVSASASAAFEGEFKKTNTQTKSTLYGTSYGCSYPYDYVLYNQNHYRSYKYKIMAHPDPKFAPDGSTYKFMTIDVPRKSGPDIYKTNLDTYNKNRGKGPEIGTDVFKHTVGDIYTYPAKADKDTIKGKYDTWEVPTHLTVGEGTGTNTGTITLSSENTSGKSTTLGVEFTAGMSVGGVGFESSCGYSSTNTYEVSIGKSTSYAGTVGDIQSGWSSHKYFWGMFVYNYTPSKSKRFQVINYWVEEPPLYPVRHALKFDGSNDYVQIPDASALRSASFTIELWFKADKRQTQKLATKTSSSNRWRVFMVKSGENYIIEFDRLSGEIGNLKTTTTINPNTWYHVAAVYDAAGQTAKLYLNGKLEASATGVADMGGASTGGITLGKVVPYNGAYLAGAIDEVRFWNYTRSQAEIQGVMNTTLNGNESGLAGYWKFDDGSGTTAADSTANKNNGTLTNYSDPPGNAWTTFYAPVD